MPHPYLAQKIADTYQLVSVAFTDEKLKREIITRLIKDLVLTPDDWKVCNQMAIEMFLKEEANQKKIAEDGQNLRKEMDKPDSKLWRLWRQRSTNPQPLLEYVAKNKQAVAAYMEQVKKNPMHYQSLFDDNMFDVITKVEALIAETPKAEAKTATQEPSSAKAYTT